MIGKTGFLKIDINNKNTSDAYILINKKIEFFIEVIQKTIIHVQKNKFLDILGISDVNLCIEKLGEISVKIENIQQNKYSVENLINLLQNINNDLSSILKNYGTESLEDLLLICLGSNNKNKNKIEDDEKFYLLKKYFHPISYKVINKKEDNKKKNEENQEDLENLCCSDISSLYKQFHMKVYGLKLLVNNSEQKKSLII